MFGARDLVFLGAGLFLAVAALALPADLFVRLGAGVAVAALAMVAASVRVGRDRLEPERYLLRRLRFRPARYAHFAEAQPLAPVRPEPGPAPAAPAEAGERQPGGLSAGAAEGGPAPATFVLEAEWVNRALSAGMLALGLSAAALLARGGADEAGLILRGILGGLRP
jgi:hypothetical protein